MIILGLTGSIGMGKSTTAELFVAEGIAVCDSDAVVHQLYQSEAVPLIEDAFNGTTREVVYDGDPGGAFQECIPVVVHGIMQDDGVFNGDEVEVKHGNDYEEKHDDRLDEAEADSQACQAAASGSNQ